MIRLGALVGGLVLGTAAIGHVTSLNAQNLAPAEANGPLIGQLNCADFSKNIDGSWTSSTNAMIGGNQFPNNIFKSHAVSFDGVDIATALNHKCGKSPENQLKADR